MDDLVDLDDLVGIHLLDPDLDNFCGNMEMQNAKPRVFI